MLSRLATLGAGVRPLPTFVSSSANRVASSTSLTVTAPTGIQNGDLIVALTFSTSTTVAISPPSGFSQIFNDVAANPAVTLNTKVAASESGNYTFTSNASATFTVIMLVYRNATNINTVGAITRAASATATAASITPSYRGVLLAAFSNSSSATVATSPSGMTSKVSSATVQNLAPFARAYELSPQDVAATGNKSLFWQTSATVSSQLFQVTNEPDIAPTFVNSETVSLEDGSTLPLTVPSGVQAGDLMVAIMTANTDSLSSTSWTSPAGWTEVGESSGSKAVALSYKVATASEPASYTFTASPNFPFIAGSMLIFRNGAFDTIGTFSGTTNLSSVSPILSQSLLLACGHAGVSGATIGTSTTMTDRVVNNVATFNSYKVSEQKVSKGPTGVRVMSSSSKGVLLSIKPTRSLA